MVIVSCSTKLHAFNLAEQLQNHGLLEKFFTTYAYQKNRIARNFIRRVDREEIDKRAISTNLPVGFMHKWYHDKFRTNSWFESWVQQKLKQETARIFIGWSGMSLEAMRQARKQGMITIVERGSSHISFQNKILGEEYALNGRKFKIDSRVIVKELMEYAEADFISVPSAFVKRTFLQYGVSSSKILVNPYGVSRYFKPSQTERKNKKFTIVYLGSLSIRKGLNYLFTALQQLKIPTDQYDVHFIGHVADELKETVSAVKQDNWTFFGHVDHYQLADVLAGADLAVHPSIEEGMSMVIPQLLSSGIPVIATTNTGGEDIIEDNVNGYIIPIRSAEAIAEKIHYLFSERRKLEHMQAEAGKVVKMGFGWEDYGNRYINFLQTITA